MPCTDCSIKHIRQPITPSQRRRCKQLFLVIFLLRPQTMATELDVSKSRRFDIAMSRRTRRSTSLVACFQDQYVPPLTQHRHQDAKLKALFQCQDAEVEAFKHFEDAEQQTPCLYENEELRIPLAPLKYEDDEEKTLDQYEDEQEKEPGQYQDHEQNKSEQHHDGDDKKPGQYQDHEQNKSEQHHDGDDKKPEQHQDGEDKKPDHYLDYEKTLQQYQYEDGNQDEKQITPNEYGYDGKEKTPEQYQDDEHKASQQCQEADEPASEQHAEEGEEQKAQLESSELEMKTSEQRQGAKNLHAPPCAIDGVPRFSLQELIQEKQLPVREARLTSKLGGREENALADYKVSGSGVGATGGTTLAMVIRRPEGGKKSMGMIRRCVKALNQMIKAKHVSKKNATL